MTAPGTNAPSDAVLTAPRLGSLSPAMRVFSYVVMHDSGFAPNPFQGFCTLACCKPKIRNQAKAGDIVVGLSTRSERVVYAMRVGEVLTFDDYWRDQRFEAKRPRRMARSAADRCGDNIYEPVGAGEFQQLPSAHSNRDGSTNLAQMKHDLGSPNVLVADAFAYFGDGAPPLPDDLAFLRAWRGHRSRFTDGEVEQVGRWFAKLPRGVFGPPALWRQDDGSWRVETGRVCTPWRS